MSFTLLWLVSCTHFILACFVSSKNPKHSSSNHALCHFNLCKLRLSLFEVLISSLMLSQALFMASPSGQFAKAQNLFVISVWYCFLTFSSFSFLRFSLSPSNLCAACLPTANLSLNSATTRQWSVSQSAPLKLHTSSTLECHLLSINMWSIWLWVFPSREVWVYYECFGVGTLCC